MFATWSALANTEPHHHLHLAVVTDARLVPGRHQAGHQVGRQVHAVKPGLGHVLTSVKSVFPNPRVEKSKAVFIVQTFPNPIQDFAIFGLEVSGRVTLCQYHIPVTGHYRQPVPHGEEVGGQLRWATTCQENQEAQEAGWYKDG